MKTATLLITDNAMGKMSITTDGARYHTTIDGYHGKAICYKTSDIMVERYKDELNDLLKQACDKCEKYPCNCKGVEK